MTPTPTVRFAPSPTGRLHIGNARTALLNWLFARQHGGKYVLRYDDTDRARSTEAFARGIAEDLAWLGIVPDLSVRQSERFDRYAAAVETLRAAGRLYACYETEEELEYRRRRQLALHRPPIYDRAALGLSEGERAKLEAEGRKPYWRFLLEHRTVAFDDLVRGAQTIDCASLSDPVLVRADGTYLYTLPSVVDDIDLGITHIIRGEDHVTNSAVQIQLFEALGATAPHFAHHNLLTLPSGAGLSKRLGHLALAELRQAGYEPTAVAALAVLIGTSHAIEPIQNLEDLAGKVRLADVSHSAAKFDPAELSQLNARTLHQMPYAAAAGRLSALGISGGEAFWDAVRGNLEIFAEAAAWWTLVVGPVTPVVADEDRDFIHAAAKHLPAEPFDADTWGRWTEALKAATGRKGKALFRPLRLALTGQEHGPELKALLPLIGRARAMGRLKSLDNYSAAQLGRGTAKPQRIRDPIHDLIEFGTDDLDRMAWDILNSNEFQRLRRIKQLGFSELVFPGATHSRLAHSIGVFHTARRLSGLIADRLGDDFSWDKAKVAQAAALVHDLGHGPLSHAFEDALKHLGIKKRHEAWTTEIVTGDTAVCEILARYSDGFQEEVAALLASDTPVDIYSAIVSSQFDADRLDYVRRDRLMTGAQHGGFDFPWLMANLEVDRVAVSLDGEQYGEVQSLILGNKAFQAAEAYVLGLFHLYFTVYFHKATRSAEKMLAAALQRIGELVREGHVEDTGLNAQSRILKFLRDQSLSSYLALDDAVIWASLHDMALATDPILAELSSRLLNRKLYKGIDVTARLKDKGGDASVARFRAQLVAARREMGQFDVLEDQATRNPYLRRGFDSPEALSKVLIRRMDGTGYEDLADRSAVVAALHQQSTFRVYVRSDAVRERIDAILEGIAK